MQCPACEQNSISFLSKALLIIRIQIRCKSCASYLKPSFLSALIAYLVSSLIATFAVSTFFLPVHISVPIVLFVVGAELPFMFVVLKAESVSNIAKRVRKRNVRV
jgi:hypothetical protein